VGLETTLACICLSPFAVLKRVLVATECLVAVAMPGNLAGIALLNWGMALCLAGALCRHRMRRSIGTIWAAQHRKNGPEQTFATDRDAAARPVRADLDALSSNLAK